MLVGSVLDTAPTRSNAAGNAGSNEGDNADGNADGSIVSLRYEVLFQAMRSSTQVSSHLEYYRWLQTEISAFIPHKSVLAAWGDFEAGELNFDLASSLEGDTTQNLRQVSDLKNILSRLFRGVRDSGRSWTVLTNLPEKAEAIGLDLNSPFYRKHFKLPQALLVYVMRCERGAYDCMYIFSVEKAGQEVDLTVLDLVMPHVDAALRRVKCLCSPSETEPELDGSSLSDREHEVLNWVSQGKSNEEIGQILGISRNTVKNHLKRIFAKMGVTARSQAVRVYLESHA